MYYKHVCICVYDCICKEIALNNVYLTYIDNLSYIYIYIDRPSLQDYESEQDARDLRQNDVYTTGHDARKRTHWGHLC